MKAGLPAGWRIGDKTGANGTDANNIGIVLGRRLVRRCWSRRTSRASDADPAAKECGVAAAVGTLVSGIGVN
ncbi:MAG: hypothetical protein U5K76_02910 [Woeseiaceae bacterium]|nr:hypothetical protein [Woeseiaceae bacterium]